MTVTARPLHATGVHRMSYQLPQDEEGENTLDTAFQLGWDHARYGVTPPLETWCGHLRLQQGFRAGRATFGRRARPANTEVRDWLDLRLQALRQRIAFETVQLTPHFLGQLQVTHCPVTRERLTDRLDATSDRCITRLRSDAGFAAGHLAVVSVRARQARGSLGLAGLQQRQRSCEVDAALREGLDGAQWARWITLCSFSTTMEHAEAARLPLRVLPPNRLRLFNPVQALQTLLSRALLHRTPSRRLAALRARLPAQALGAFDAWLLAYRVRVSLLLSQQSADALPQWALEDAWQEREILRCWQRFASRLEAQQCERIVLECSEGKAHWLPEAAATDGWVLEHGGQRPAQPVRSLPRLREPKLQFSLFRSAA